MIALNGIFITMILLITNVSRNSPNCTVGIIFSGDHDVLNRVAFVEQKLNTSDPNADHSNVTLQKGIYDWALDTYRFSCACAHVLYHRDCLLESLFLCRSFAKVRIRGTFATSRVR